jgi:tyrosine-protein kinase Etk/Wzc
MNTDQTNSNGNDSYDNSQSSQTNQSSPSNRSSRSRQSSQSNQSSQNYSNNQPQGPLIQDDDTISLADILDNVLFYRWHFIAVTILAVVLSAAYALIATPIYTADALIQVESKSGGSMLGALDKVADPFSALGGKSPVIDEMEIIKSRTVLGKAITDLKVNVNVKADNRLPIIGNWLARVMEPEDKGLVKPPITWLSYVWGGEQLNIDLIHVPRTLYGEPLLLTIGQDRTWKLIVKESDRELAQGQGSGELISNDDGQFQIQLGAFAAYPGTVFEVTVQSLQSVIGSTLANLKVAEAVRGSNLIDLTYESADPEFAAQILNTISDVYLKQNLNRKSAEAEKTLAFLKRELPIFRKKLDKSEEDLTAFRSQSRTIDMTVELTGLLTLSSQLETQRIELDIKQREFAIRYDANHPVMKALKAQLNGVEQQASKLSQQIGRLPAVQQDFLRLSRDVEVNNLLYVSLLNNAQQLEIANAGTVGNVAIIDRAVVPEFATKPKKSLVVAIGTMAGLLLGFLLTQLMGMIEKVVRDPKKLETETGVPNLAILPIVGAQMERLENNDESAFMVAKEEPDSVEVETLRSLRTALIFALSEKPRSKVTLITSAVPSQGKSFISANLAYLLAATGKRTLLIDADIRKSSSHRYFEYDTKSAGLSAVLRGSNTVEESIIKSAYDNLDFFPPGPRVRSPGDLLAGEKLQHIIANLAEQYDYVIIDAPPLLPVHDTRTLGKAVDISLFVARQNTVSMSEVHDAIDVFNKSGNTFDGVIFNGFIPSRLGYRYGYGYGYKYARYGKYGKKYGRYGTYGKYSQYDKYGDEGKG